MEEGPVADQMHDNETEISDFALTLRLFTYRSAFFASKGHQRPLWWKKEQRGEKKKRGKTFYKTLFSVTRKAGRGGEIRIFSSDNSHFWGNRANPLNHRSPSKWNGYFVF